MAKIARIAVIISGCGHLDGAEIRESVLTLLSLDRYSAQVVVFAPDIPQLHVINHLTGQEMQESRNVLIEAARIARGDIKNLADLKVEAFDAVVLPGGYGAAKNLSTIANQGENATVIPVLKDILLGFFKAKKPIGAICIAPAVIVAALKEATTPTVTIGEDKNGLILSLQGNHQLCATNMITVDEENKIISTPAYMRHDTLTNIATGIDKLVVKLLTMI